MKPLPALACALSLCVGANALALDLGEYRIVDLSHAFDEHTLYWPGKPPMKIAAGSGGPVRVVALIGK